MPRNCGDPSPGVRWTEQMRLLVIDTVINYRKELGGSQQALKWEDIAAQLPRPLRAFQYRHPRSRHGKVKLFKCSIQFDALIRKYRSLEREGSDSRRGYHHPIMTSNICAKLKEYQILCKKLQIRSRAAVSRVTTATASARPQSSCVENAAARVVARDGSKEFSAGTETSISTSESTSTSSEPSDYASIDDSRFILDHEHGTPGRSTEEVRKPREKIKCEGSHFEKFNVDKKGKLFELVEEELMSLTTWWEGRTVSVKRRTVNNAMAFATTRGPKQARLTRPTRSLDEPIEGHLQTKRHSLHRKIRRSFQQLRVNLERELHQISKVPDDMH